jgi:predicted HTH domain antitoxin
MIVFDASTLILVTKAELLDSFLADVRMDRENYDFLQEMAKEEGSDLSKAVRDTATRGRILLAVERYKKGEDSLGRAAELAGVPLGQMMMILKEFGVESRLEKEDYLEGLKHLQKAW